jgi:hypothetical protein
MKQEAARPSEHVLSREERTVAATVAVSQGIEE